MPPSLSGTTGMLSLSPSSIFFFVLPKKLHWPSKIFICSFQEKNQRQNPAVEKHTFKDPRAKGGGERHSINFSLRFSSLDLYAVAP